MLDRSFSLTLALRAVARGAGHTIDVDDLHAALGLSMAPCAVPGLADAADWCAYARDVFLAPAARLFGITMRDLHPPEAARGLGGAPEFSQHFDASYKPLIERALENGQSVLAWQGWPGEARLMWGQLRERVDTGVWFRGIVQSDPAPLPEPPVVSLESPPVQVYVVEKVDPVEPEPLDLLRMAVEHARRMLRGEMTTRFGVVAGGAAITHAIELVRAKRGAGPVSPSFARSHHQFASAVVAGYTSAARFFFRMQQRLGERDVPLTASLLGSCRLVCMAFTPSTNFHQCRAILAVPEGRTKLIDHMAQAARAADDIRAIIDVHAHEVGL